MSRLLVLVALVFSSLHLLSPVCADQFELELAFEADHTAAGPAGWGGGPPQTIHLDGDVVHGGEWSVRIERIAESADKFTVLTRSLSLDYQGSKISLSGFIRTEGISTFAGLWLRQDGDSGILEFDNMQNRSLKGDTEWTEYRIELPLHPGARRLLFGGLVSGTGKAWFDDLALRIDGKPIAEASRREVVETVMDRDREFDEGSGFTVSQASAAQVARLALLGKVWGFLKYHHPRVTGGELHWDYELFRVLPKVFAAEQGSQVLLDWCETHVTAAADCNPCADPPDDAHLSPSLDWIDDTNLVVPELGKWLRAVHQNRHAGGAQFYVAQNAGVGNPKFTHERKYASLAQFDAGFRLLALFRFWNIIEYWFPYRDVIGEDWDSVLLEFIPRFLAATTTDQYKLELMALIARIHDTHANLWSSLDVRPPRGTSQLPVSLRFIEGKATVVALLQEKAGVDGLRVGDVIEAIDGRAVAELVDEWRPYYAASNEPTRLRDLARALTQGTAGPCVVRISRATETFESTVARVPRSDLDFSGTRRHDRSGETFQKLGDDIAYLKLSSTEAARAAEYVAAAEGTKGLILDIRNYPSEFMVFALGSRLVAEPTPFTRFTRGDLSNPGAFFWTGPLTLTPQTPRYEGKVVILVDEVSQSQAEYTTMAFRVAPGALVVGSTTAGADGNVSPIPLPGGLRSMISGIGVFYPDKTPTQRVGIVPDVEVLPTLAGIREGRDELLEEAIRRILGDGVSEESVRRLARP